MNPLDKPIQQVTGWPIGQLVVNKCCNAVLVRDCRLTQWERKFLLDLMDSRRAEKPDLLSIRVREILCEIASKVDDIPGI